MSNHLVYPAPTVVVGIGRLGLAALERLGDDWMGLQLSGADASIRNLRLISIRPDGAGGRTAGDGAGRGDQEWCLRELPAARISRHLGDGDLPSRALDLAVLRSLGLVRYRDGTYQVGMPRDGGAVELDRGEEAAAGGPLRGRRLAHRRRYFEWVNLSPDPIVAAERLRQATEQSKELDLFLTPLVNRVRQGSPRTLLATIDRCFAFLEGRDPGPWTWLDPQAPPQPEDAEVVLPVTEALIGLDGGARRADLQLGDVAEPLQGWRAWLQPDPGQAAAGDPPRLALRVPRAFTRGPADAASPVAPRELLARDWQATSWTTDAHDGEATTFLPLPVTSFRLGLFDHDGREVEPEVRERFTDRLRELGRQVHSGLARLWVDLQRVRVAEPDSHLKLQGRARDELADALEQSLEILGELVVRPLATSGEEPAAGAPSELPCRPKAAAEEELPHEPSRFLSGMVVDEGVAADPVRRLLVERLTELGLADPGELDIFRRPLLTDRTLAPADLDKTEDAPTGDGPEGGPAAEPARSRGLQALRRELNAHVRSLFDFEFLTRYRQRPTRRPPRLTVFVVGDMSEPFVRACLRPVLREIHAELLRAFTPVFRTYREGFDRSLCVTPILWMPHPADPFEGGDPGPTRREEAAIIDAVHGVRHWVECVLPAGKRFIPQIFVNSRVTDLATLTLRDAIRQTRDFISFQIRNDLSGEPWLRHTSAGSGQADLFSSFSCYEIDFPALRCREYLANRMAHELLDTILDPQASVAGNERQRDEETVALLSPPSLDELAEEIRAELREVTGRAGEEVRQSALAPLTISEAIRASEVEESYGEAFEVAMRRRILARWRELTGKLGKTDDMVDDLRRETCGLLSRRLRELREHDDRTILDSIGEGGLARALGRLHRLRSRCRDLFQDHETRRRDREETAGRHAIPELRPLETSRRDLLAAARAKPDLEPIRLGTGLLAAFALVLGAPLAHAVSYLADLHLQGGVLEALLGPLAPLTGGLVLWLPAWLLLRRHLRRRTEAVRDAQERLGGAAARILRGTGRRLPEEPPTSIRSFLEARLELTAAVAIRGFSRHLLERVLADTHLAERLHRSVDVQRQTLLRRAEDLGVRASLDGEEGEQDLERLLEGHGSHRSERLIRGESLRRYYHQKIRQPADLHAELACFVAAVGGIGRWRTEACLADTDAVLRYCRHTFREIVDEAIWAQPFFREDLARSLTEFVARCYSNVGFGAEFRGYEGLDPDGVPVAADAALVLHHELGRVLEDEWKRMPAFASTKKPRKPKTADIRPNAAYMLSLVQGIRVHSLRNLRRFESFHDRIEMPDDRAFPLTQETREERSGHPLNLLSGLETFSLERTRRLLAAQPGESEGGPIRGE